MRRANNIGGWSAYIKVDGRSLYLGLYATKEEAAEAYRAGSRKHFKEFSAL